VNEKIALRNKKERMETMKTLKLCVFASLVLALGAQAWAATATVPSITPGVKFLRSYNEDNGSTYTPNANFNPANLGVFLPADSGAVNGFDRTKPAAAQAQPGNAGELEDTWGLFHLYYIAPGVLNSPADTKVINPGPTEVNNGIGANGTWLVGMFWGGNDTQIKFNSDGTVVIDTEDVHFSLWAVNKTDLVSADANPPAFDTLVSFNAANRTGPDTYTGWVDGVNGTLLLEGVSTEFQFVGQLGVGGADFQAVTTAYFDIDQNAGLWGPTWGVLGDLNSLINSIPSDAYFQWTDQNGNRDWLVSSNDLGGTSIAAAIPEPLTMLGLALGIGSIGGYLRRRTRVG